MQPHQHYSGTHLHRLCNSDINQIHLSVLYDVAFNQAKRRLDGRRKVSWHGLILEESAQPIKDENQALDVLFEEAVRKPLEVMPEEKTEAASVLPRARWLRQVMQGKHNAVAEKLDRGLDNESLIRSIRNNSHGFRSFEDIRKTDWMLLFSMLLGDDVVAIVNRLAPVRCLLKNGKSYKIEYGKGIYDNILFNLNPNCIKIGVSFFEKEKKIISSENHDIKLDYCQTINQLYKFI